MVTFVTKWDAIAEKRPNASAIFTTSLILHGMEQFRHRPDVIRDSRRYARRDSDAGMYAAQVVMCEMQGDRGF
jgi:hypothetical protein